MNNLSKITVIGGGSWGTALASLLAGKGYQVALLVRNQELACAINNQHENVRYLPGLKLPVNISAYTSPQAALQGANVLLWAIPCQSSRKVLRELKPHFGLKPLLFRTFRAIICKGSGSANAHCCGAGLPQCGAWLQLARSFFY